MAELPKQFRHGLLDAREAQFKSAIGLQIRIFDFARAIGEERAEVMRLRGSVGKIAQQEFFVQ